MREVQITANEAPKLQGTGLLAYRLWVDGGGMFYVQITENSAAGTFPRCLFSVARYAPKRHDRDLGDLVGVDLEGKEQEVRGNNGDGFLRAVLCHLLDGEVTA